MVTYRHITILTLAFLIWLSSISDAEYLIYLKGGHFIVVDDCTFSTRQGTEKGPRVNEQAIPVEDCSTEGRPEGPIFWSTIDGHFGEVNADDVYAIFGTRSAPKRFDKALDLEDYLITQRGESFVNAKVLTEKGVEVFGLKRDDLSKINRRGIFEIAPEHLAGSRSGEGLCPGESIDFAVTDVELVEGHLLGIITNLSKERWHPLIDVEVRVKGRFLGKFKVRDENVLDSGKTASMDSEVPNRFLKELERLKADEAGVRLCYRKVRGEREGSR